MSMMPSFGKKSPDLLGTLTIGVASGTDPTAESLSERLLRVARGHIESEIATLDEAKTLLEAADDPVVCFVLTQYLEEEQHHHDMFVRLAQQFAEELEPIGRESILPTDGRRLRNPLLAERLGELGKNERHGIARLKDLAKENRKEYRGVLSLLLEMVALDSTKHERMLKFAQKVVA